MVPHPKKFVLPSPFRFSTNFGKGPETRGIRFYRSRYVGRHVSFNQRSRRHCPGDSVYYPGPCCTWTSMSLGAVLSTYPIHPRRYTRTTTLPCPSDTPSRLRTRTTFAWEGPEAFPRPSLRRLRLEAPHFVCQDLTPSAVNATDRPWRPSEHNKISRGDGDRCILTDRLLIFPLLKFTLLYREMRFWFKL